MSGVETIEDISVNADPVVGIEAPKEADPAVRIEVPRRKDLPIVPFSVGAKETDEQLDMWTFECKQTDFHFEGKECEKWVVDGGDGQIWLARYPEPNNEVIGFLSLAKGAIAPSKEELEKWHFVSRSEYSHGDEYFLCYELENAGGRLLVNKYNGEIKSYTKNLDF